MRYVCSFLLIIISLPLFAQDSSATIHVQKDSGVYTKLDTMPNPIGGKYFAELVDYPEKEREARIEGIVYVSFIIEKDGTMDSIKVVMPVEAGLDAAALKAINRFPKKWVPGIKNGKPVRVKEAIPINFSLK